MGKKKESKGLDFEAIKKDHETLKEILDTIDAEHTNAIKAGVDKHLRDKKTGRIKYSLLKDNSELQLKYADTIADHYVDAVSKQIKKPKDKFEESLLLRAFYGTSRENIRKHVADNAHKLTIGTYTREIAPKLLEQLEEELTPVVYRDITNKEHIKQVVAHTKAGELVDSSAMSTADAVRLLALYHVNDVITPKILPLNAPYIKKKKKE